MNPAHPYLYSYLPCSQTFWEFANLPDGLPYLASRLEWRLMEWVLVYRPKHAHTVKIKLPELTTRPVRRRHHSPLCPLVHGVLQQASGETGTCLLPVVVTPFTGKLSFPPRMARSTYLEQGWPTVMRQRFFLTHFIYVIHNCTVSFSRLWYINVSWISLWGQSKLIQERFESKISSQNFVEIFLETNSWSR